MNCIIATAVVRIMAARTHGDNEGERCNFMIRYGPSDCASNGVPAVKQIASNKSANRTFFRARKRASGKTVYRDLSKKAKRLIAAQVFIRAQPIVPVFVKGKEICRN